MQFVESLALNLASHEEVISSLILNNCNEPVHITKI